MKTKRWALILAVLLLLALIEFAISRWSITEGSIHFVNQGPTPIEGLAVLFEGRTYTIDRIAPGARSGLYVGSPGKGPLRVTYRSGGASLGGFSLPEYDPATLAADGQRLVLVVDGNQIMRYQEDTAAGSGGPWNRFKAALAPYW
ncbi:hypothetical protein EP7_001445 [Isosphaeraceae bacterium EP7]